MSGTAGCTREVRKIGRTMTAGVERGNMTAHKTKISGEIAVVCLMNDKILTSRAEM